MAKYDLSTVSAIQDSASLARKRASEEPNQGGYNAAWLHGYADGLNDVGKQLLPPPEVVATIRKHYCAVVAALDDAEKIYALNRRSVKSREIFQFIAAQEQILSNLAHELGIELTDENLDPIDA